MRIDELMTAINKAGLEHDASARGRKSAKFKFRISKDGNEYVVTTVDSTGAPARIQADGVAGPAGRALSVFNKNAGSRNDIWAPRASGNEVGQVGLSDNPDLLYALGSCGNVVAADGSPVVFAHEIGKPVLCIDEVGNDMLRGRLRLDLKETAVEDFDFLSDSFVISGNKVYQTDSVGPNSSRLDIFTQEFRKDSLESFVAVFLSYVHAVAVEYSGKRLKVLSKPAESVPTIIVAKIEQDKTLELRLSWTASALSDDEAFESIGSDYLVTLTDKAFAARPIEPVDEEEVGEQILDFIGKYAPTKAAKRELAFYDGVFYIPEETASVLLLEGLPLLLKKYRVLGLDRLMGYKVRPATPHLNVRFGSGIDFLGADATVDVDGEKFSLQAFLDAYRKDRFIGLKDGTRVVVDEEYVKRLQRIFRIDKKGNAKVSFFDIPEVERLLDEGARKDKSLARPRSFYEGLSALSSAKVDLPPVNADMRSYQVEGYKWLSYLYRNNMGGCLADDMGLGKTLQVIALLASVYPGADRPSLIVMPRSLLFNWQCELEKFAPQLDFGFYYGTGRDLAESMKHQVVLTTYAMVRNDIELLSKEKFHMAVLDESQTIKNVQAQQTRSIYMVDADHRFALSGTPVENNLSELYSLYRFLNPGMFGTLDEFNANYANPIQKNEDKAAADALRRKIFPFMLRRMKKDVLKDLPDRVDNTVFVDMEPEMERFYNQRRMYYLERVRETIATEGVAKSQFVMFQALTELRRIASVPESLSDGRISSPKLEAIADSVISAVENGHKAVVFFNFIAGIEILGQKLEKAGIDFAVMTGATRNRSEQVNRFQNDPDCRVFLMTLKTGGVGLNLTAADMVFVVEPWWNKAAEEQAVNRLYRIGQKNTVFCFYYITHNTIEEKIRQLQQMKADLFDSVISSDESMSKNLSEDDINFILS